MVYDVLIIGGGPAGLYASFYAGLRDLSVCLLEAQTELGGKINFYPEKMVWDVGALPPTKGKQLKHQLIDQALIFQPTVHTDTRVVSLSKEKAFFHAIDDQGRSYRGKSVLVCIGGGIVAPNKLPCSIQRNSGDYIHYQFPDPALIKGKHLVISGGGDAAVDYALEAANYGAKVTLCYRGANFKAHEAQVKKMKAANISIRTNHIISKVEQAKNFPLVLSLKDSSDQETTCLCDHLLVQHGYQHDSTLLDRIDFDLTRHEAFYLHCEVPTKTSFAGVFAAGDIHYFKGKLNLLAGAFQDAAQAINQIKAYLQPESHPQAMVSSHNKKFAQMNQELFKNG